MDREKNNSTFKVFTEEELQRRMKYAKPLTSEQFFERLKEIKSRQKRD